MIYDMTPLTRADTITRWIRRYADENQIRTLVVGISGGIDSAVVSTLSARTGLETIAVSMPIRQSRHTHDLSMRHGQWLSERFDNVQHRIVKLDPVWRQFERLWGDATDLGLANSRSRLRMMTLYQISQDHGGIVVGTGNRVEDFGVGFFTKYGDGGVDISPIGDCLKTQVWDMGRALGILPEIIDAAPTDGLWDDGRTDEDQIGMSYPDLERMMTLDDLPQPGNIPPDDGVRLERYRAFRRRNLHKMQPIPVCRFDG